MLGTIIIFILILFVLVLVHEWGHFIVAKKTGMRVDEFGIGFPPKLWSLRRGETEYSLNALPIGGFVRIYGENAEDAAEDAAAGSTVEGAFTTKSKWAQAAVLLAGVTMNIILAWLLFAVVLMVGIPTAVTEGQQGADHATLRITEVVAHGPAAEAGIPVGATVTKLQSGSTIISNVTPSKFSDFTSRHPGQAIKVIYTANGQEHTTAVTPKTGLIPNDPSRAAIGVAVSFVAMVQQSLPQALWHATAMTGQGLVTIVEGVGKLIWHSIRGTANFSQVAGPVGLVGLVGNAEHFGVTSVLMFMAMISLNLAVINILPFPALDGGRLLFVAIEAVIRRPINPIWTARVNLVGFALLMVLMVVVTWHDIYRIVAG